MLYIVLVVVINVVQLHVAKRNFPKWDNKVYLALNQWCPWIGRPCRNTESLSVKESEPSTGYNLCSAALTDKASTFKVLNFGYVFI